MWGVKTYRLSVITGFKSATTPGLQSKYNVTQDAMRQSLRSAGNQEQNAHDSVLLWLLREVVRDVGSTEGFLVCAMHKVPERINIGTEWSMFNAGIVGMSTLKSDKNTCNILAIEIIGLLLSSFIIAKIGRFKPGIRFRIFPWCEVVSC